MVEHIWVDKQHAFLLAGGCAVLDYSETCVSGSVIVVVHWDLVVTALEVRIGGADTENRTIFPCNVMPFRGLVDQSLRTKRSKKEEELTSWWLNALNTAGAADTCPASALKVNRTKVVEGSIPLARSVAFH